MGYVNDKTHEVKEGLQELRRGEGVVWKVNVSGWEIPPTPQAVVIRRERDDELVTSQFITGSGAPTLGASNELVLPEITVPTDAQLGIYRLDLPFEAGGFSPGRPYVRFLVKA